MRIWIGVMALLALTTGCNRSQAVKAPPPPPEVGVALVEQKDITLQRDFTARTEAVPTVEIRARISGVLEQVLFKEGTEAKKGQTLFVIQQAEYKAALETAKAQLAKAQADLVRATDTSIVDRARAGLDEKKADYGKTQQDVRRYRPLAEARAIPQQDLDTSIAAEKVAAASVQVSEAALRDAQLAQRTQVHLAEAAVESAKASIIQAELNLSYTTIAAPITGIVGKLQVDQGNLVGKADPTLLTTISAVDPIYADFSVAEVDYLRIAPRIRLDPQAKQPANPIPLDLILADNQVFPHKGRFVFIDRQVDAKTGTIAVRAAFPNPDKAVRPGQFGRVRTSVEERPGALLVPQLAVVEQQGTKIALVVDSNNTVTMRTLALDERVGDNYLVTGGLKAGERVIVDGVQKVRPGMQVKAVVKTATKPGDKPAEQPAAETPGKTTR
jgi:membrane fusion protein (multidrug efflux system)